MSRPPLWPDLRLRHDVTEQMENPAGDPARLEATLGQFTHVDRWISRTRALLARHVFPLLRANPKKEHHLVELGAGGADTAAWAAAAARREGLRLRVTALDHDPRAVRFARKRHGRQPGLTLLERDLADWTGLGPVDIAFGNHILHHLKEERIVELLRDLAGRGLSLVLLSDLERRRWAYLPFYAAGSLLFHGSYTTEDGLTSIRRAFTREELARLAELARAGYTVRSAFPARLILMGRFSGDSAAVAPHGP